MSASAPDPVFGTGGKLLEPGAHVVPAGMTLQADGKVLVAATVGATAGQHDLAVYRFNADGSPDKTFGPSHTGMFEFPIGGEERAAGVAVGKDGTVWVAGTKISGKNADGFDDAHIILTRVTKDGLPALFGGGGIYLRPHFDLDQDTAGGDDETHAVGVVVQPGGDVVVGGWGRGTDEYHPTGVSYIAAARYHASGALDTSFGSDLWTRDHDGQVEKWLGSGSRAQSHVNRMTQDAAGHLYFVGSEYAGGAGGTTIFTSDLGRDGHGEDYTSNGANGVGQAAEGFGAAVDATGGLIVVGKTRFAGDALDSPILARMKPGAYDADVPATNSAVASLSGLRNSGSVFRDVAILPDGNILAVGTKGDGSLLLARFNFLGQLDKSFGANGVTGTTLGAKADARGLAVTPQGRVLALADATSSQDGTDHVGFARFQGVPTKPAMPTEVSARPLDAHTARVYWKANDAKATGFKVEHSGAPFGTPGAAVFFKTFAATAKSGDVGGLVAQGRYYFRVTAYNFAGARNVAYSAPSYSVSTTTYGLIRTPVRIDAGGSGYSAYSAQTGWTTFAADAGAVGGTATAGAAAVGGTGDDPLYQSRRQGAAFAYNIAAANGAYTLKLHFFDPTSTGLLQRQFDVLAQGTKVLSNFDLYAAGNGAKQAVVRTFNVTVTDGQLHLAFLGKIGTATVSAIELLPT
ncbi:MAG TPA: malectin domain-containing carbohydrate-binding protein, partial [Humisphaera sp.]